MIAFVTSLSLSLSLNLSLGTTQGVNADPGEEEGFDLFSDLGGRAGLALSQAELDRLGPQRVSVDGERWEHLKAAAEHEDTPEPGAAPWAATRDVVLEQSEQGLRIRASWELRSNRAGWWTGPLIGPLRGVRVESATFRGKALSVTHTPAGAEVAVKFSEAGRGRVELVAFVPNADLSGGPFRDPLGALSLWIMPAVRGELRTRRVGRLKAKLAEDPRVLQVVVQGGLRPEIDGRVWAAEAQLDLNWEQPAEAAPENQAPLAAAQSAVGITFGGGELRAKARLSWLLRRGSLQRVSFDVKGVGKDLDVRGANLLSWARQGNRVEVVLKEASDTRVDLDLSWSQALPSGAEASLAAPQLSPAQAYRTDRYMQLARDGELEVVPQLRGWSAVGSTELPEWAGGQIEGNASASYHSESGDQGSSFGLLRFVPLSGPPVVVDVAAYEIATSDEGRALVQARYEVRNEAASHLQVRLPKGSRLLGTRVSGETVTPAREAGDRGQDTWRVPIVRSLESVKGSLSFPVEIIFISESKTWTKKEDRELQLPTLDAPVAVSRVRVHLPPKYDNKVDVGDFHRVGNFNKGDGITYGLGVGAAAAAQVGNADQLYRSALDSWMSNDFGSAQSSLDDLRALGASSRNIDGLQANLDLVQGDNRPGGTGKSDAPAEPAQQGQSAVVSRRIKDQAMMRAADDRIALDKKAAEAEKLEAEGRYDDAEAKLAEAQEIGGRLALLEQEESKELHVYNQALSSSSARISGKRKRKVSREKKAKRPKTKGRWKSKAPGREEGTKQALGEREGKVAAVKFERSIDVQDPVHTLPATGVANGAVVVPEPTDMPADALATDAGVVRGNTAGEAASSPVQSDFGILGAGELEAGEGVPPPPPVRAPPRAQAAEVRVYDFEDDTIDGQILMPSGGETSELRGLEQAKVIPVGGSTSRDFTAVVDVSPTSTEDSAGFVLEGATISKAVSALPGVYRGPGKKRRRRGKSKKVRRNKSAPQATAAPESAEPPRAPVAGASPPVDPNEALAGPVATASAVSVHIPAIGQAVLYQHMLLREGQPLVVHLQAQRQKSK